MRQANWASKMINLADGGAGALVANSNYGWYEPGEETATLIGFIRCFTIQFSKKVPGASVRLYIAQKNG